MIYDLDSMSTEAPSHDPLLQVLLAWLGLASLGPYGGKADSVPTILWLSMATPELRAMGNLPNQHRTTQSKHSAEAPQGKASGLWFVRADSQRLSTSRQEECDAS